MAVVTIDAKAELAQIQAAIDAENAPEQATAPSAEAKAKPNLPIDRTAHEVETRLDQLVEDSEKAEAEKPDFAKELGLTAEQHKAITSIFDKKIGKKVRETREAEEFAAAQYSERKLAEARAAELERENAQLRANTQSAAVPRETAEKARPERKDFQSDQAYLDAVIAWGVEDGLKKRAAEEAKQAAERRQAEILETARERIGRALEFVPDFAEITSKADVEVPSVVAGYMQKSDMFAELGYYLAQHPDILKTLSKLEPDQQLVTIGKIESTLKPFGSSDSKVNGGAKPSEEAVPSERTSKEAASSEAGISPSRARSSAPVITPLNGNGAAGGPVDPEHMTIRQHIADHAKRHGSHLSLRKRH